MLDLTPLLKVYAKRRLNYLCREDYAKIQRKSLLKLLYKARDTQFGKDYQFSTIKSVSQFQSRVPLRNYDALWQDYWKQHFPLLNNVTWPGTITYFASSSGTSTGTTKHIPLTREMMRSNTRAGLDTLVHHISNFPQTNIFGGKNFVLGGSTALDERAPGIFSGDLSGIVAKTLPWWAKSRYFPDKKLALISDWEEKIDALVKKACKEDIRNISGVPSWLLIFLDKLFAQNPNAQRDVYKIWPNLKMLVHGGVNFTPYLNQFEDIFGKNRIDFREVYPASEGFIALGDRGFNEGMRMILDGDIFYEFVPLDELDQKQPTRHWIENVELDINYALVMTTCAGLWSYIIGDTIRFVEKDPPRLLVTGRTSYYLSAFGEHVIQEEVEDSVSTAAMAINKEVVDYSVSPLYPKNESELGGHLYVVEFADSHPSEAEMVRFVTVLDSKLSERNEDYRAHRSNGFGLRPPQVLVAKHGTFMAWMKSRGKLGGQNKVPRIVNDADLAASLKEFAQSFKE
jgi:hypothetical protein